MDARPVGIAAPRGARASSGLRVLILAVIATIGLIVAAGPASASDGTFSLMWGWGVDDGANEFQICTSDCQAGIAGLGDGQFNLPRGVATDAAGDVYVTDTQNNRIQKFASDGAFLTKWGSLGGDDGRFSVPNGVATDSNNDVYVADTGNNRIQKFASDGTFLTKWGSLGGDDGQFISPLGVATDAVGDVYVADGSDRIQKFDSDGNFLAKWGGPGGDDGQFDQPFGVATDAAGDVYVADTGNNRIERFGTAAPTIADLIDSVEVLDLQHGIENSLVSKLENAERNLDQSDTGGACDKLASFISAVGAQSGKKITAEDADDLIADAEAIRASLGCT
jgi:NHL repeat/FIMAH domain